MSAHNASSEPTLNKSGGSSLPGWEKFIDDSSVASHLTSANSNTVCLHSVLCTYTIWALRYANARQLLLALGPDHVGQLLLASGPVQVRQLLLASGPVHVGQLLLALEPVHVRQLLLALEPVHVGQLLLALGLFRSGSCCWL